MNIIIKKICKTLFVLLHFSYIFFLYYVSVTVYWGWKSLNWSAIISQAVACNTEQTPWNQTTDFQQDCLCTQGWMNCLHPVSPKYICAVTWR